MLAGFSPKRHLTVSKGYIFEWIEMSGNTDLEGREVGREESS